MVLTLVKTTFHAVGALAAGERPRRVVLLVVALCCLSVTCSPLARAEQTGDQAASGGPNSLAQMLADEEEFGFSYELYQVSKGDTLENIAARFGVTVASLRQFNDVTGEVSAGQSLAIPLFGSRGEPSPALSLPPLTIIEPRYATVASTSRITTEPLSVGPVDVLFEPALGTRMIVNAEQGDYWGIVMVDGSVGWIPKTALQMTNETLTAEQLDLMLKGSRTDIVQEAYRYLGVPYCYGGHLPYNVDCSLLVQTAYAARGIRLPRTAASQIEVGRSVSVSELLPGDRLYWVNRSGRIGHTGIYIGNGRFIHASSRRGAVGVDSLYESFYWSRFAGARRS